jgi:hypothetical protein
VLSTFTVHNLLDSGPDSLRAAITAANTNPGADVVDFAPGLRGMIGLTSGELGMTDSVWIDGPGTGRLAVSGNDTSRVFEISSGAAVSIDDLTVTSGRAVWRGGGENGSPRSIRIRPKHLRKRQPVQPFRRAHSYFRFACYAWYFVQPIHSSRGKTASRISSVLDLRQNAQNMDMAAIVIEPISGRQFNPRRAPQHPARWAA